jgi:hypothetical protein
MNLIGKNMFNATLITAFSLATLFLSGCGEGELAKGITDVVKKSVEGEVTKQVGQVKKQFDQIINLGAGKGQKEDGQGTARAGNEKSEKGAGKESEDEKD